MIGTHFFILVRPSKRAGRPLLHFNRWESPARSYGAEGESSSTIDPDAPADETIDLDTRSPFPCVRAPRPGDAFDRGMEGRSTPLNDSSGRRSH